MLQREILEKYTETKREGKIQHDYTTTAAQTDIPQSRAVRRYEAKNWNEKQPGKKLRLLWNTKKKEDEAMDENNRLEAKISTRRNQNQTNGELTTNSPTA